MVTVMAWVDTQKYTTRVKSQKGVVYNGDKLQKWKKEGWKPKYVDVPPIIERLSFARPVKLVHGITPSDLVFTAASGFNCQNCGLYNRHPFCSPDSPSYREAISIIRSYKNAIIFVTQNDGNDPWADDPTDLGHIQFKDRKGFALRGAEAGTTRYLQRTMKQLEHHFRRSGCRSQAFISGHCELCGRCPVKGVRDDHDKQISCPLGGLPSMETWWQDVYRWYTHGSLGQVFSENSEVVRPLTFVCQDYFTLITTLLYDSRPEKKYWYQENYKNRLSSSKKQYKLLQGKISRAVQNRKAKGIPL